MSTEVEFSPVRPAFHRTVAVRLGSPTLRYFAGVVALAAAYYSAAKLGQTLHYTGSVSAIWPPVGLGIAALYLWGLDLWPGILIGEMLVNGELFAGSSSLPLVSLLGQQAGNMAEVVVGALLLRRLMGKGAALDRPHQVGGLFGAIGIATAISATVGTLSMLAGGVIDAGEMPTFWRTWFLGDLAGGLIVAPLVIVWARDPFGAWRRIRTWEGAVTVTAVVVLGVIAVTNLHPVTYVVFPALIWAAFRFGPPGATLSVAIAAGVVIGVTANEVGPFSRQPIDAKTLSTQLYIVVAALTTLFLSAVVSEREQSLTQLARARVREDERAVEERHRIARDLHDSVSQSLFSTALQTRSAQNALEQEGVSRSGPLARSLAAIGELTRSAQSEMRALIYELGHDAPEDGLVEGLAEHAAKLAAADDLVVHVQGPDSPLALSRRVETQLFGIGREALANVVKHAGASAAWLRIEARSGSVVVEIRDDGRGFDTAAGHPGHFGLESMRSRAAEIDGLLTITSIPGRGTVVRVEVEVEPGESGSGVVDEPFADSPESGLRARAEAELAEDVRYVRAGRPLADL
jgi:signal transduction histidine kinase